MAPNRFPGWPRIIIVVLTIWISSGCQALAPFLSTPTPLPSATPNPTYTPAATLTPAPTYTPRPSATLTPSKTPLPMATTTLEIQEYYLLQEDFTQGAICFTNEVKGFYLGGQSSQSKVENGAYHFEVAAKANEIYTSPCLLIELSSYEVQVDIKILNSSNNYAAGIAIIPIYGWLESQYSSGNGLFTFMVNQKGEYCFYKHSDQSKYRCSECNAPLAGCWAPLTPSLPQESTFRMKIQRKAGRINLFLNDQPVNSLPFEEPGTSSVYIALAGGWADKNSDLEISFDNLQISLP